MPQLELETGVDGAAPPRREAEGHWPHHGAKEPAPAFMTQRVKKRLDRSRRQRGCAVNALLVTFIIIALPAMAILFGARSSASAVWVANALRLGRQAGSATTSHDTARLLGGLLPADGLDDERSCHSRFQSARYRRNAGKRPSPYLVSKLRQHEALQRRCGPGTDAYSSALEQLGSGKKMQKSYAAGDGECRYLVSISYSYQGLGNRILAATSAFLYAVLTGRVLLVDPSNHMGELFCEPFPNTTWLLPTDSFTLKGYTNFSVETVESYGNILKNNKMIKTASSRMPPPAFVYIHLNHDASGLDKLFFCDEDQRVLRDIQWLLMRTDNYIVPGLFLLTGFQEELGMLFPEPDTVFHHLGRYLLHPNNHVWAFVTRYYDAYLATARQRVGIQVRVFGADPESPQLLKQITTCTRKENLLPELLTAAEPETATAGMAARGESKAVLVTSLKSWYYEKLKSMYLEQGTVTGEAVGLHQPSHEEYQRFGAKSHDTRAWAEMYLLSLTDVLVTSGASTFGYVAQGLGGLTPWVMYKPPANGSDVADPPCGRGVSMEPCFHDPPTYDCKTNKWADTGKIVPHVQHCEDVSWGLKLVPRMA